MSSAILVFTFSFAISHTISSTDFNTSAIFGDAVSFAEHQIKVKIRTKGLGLWLLVQLISSLYFSLPAICACRNEPETSRITHETWNTCVFTWQHAGFEGSYYLFRVFLTYLFRICALVSNNLFIIVNYLFLNRLYQIVFKGHKSKGKYQFRYSFSHVCHNRY